MVTSTTSIKIRQKLFDAIGPQGDRYVFAILEDERCAITRNGEVLEVSDSDVQSIDGAVLRFLEAVKSPDEFSAID